MNKYYNYDGIEIWDQSKWRERTLPINGFVQWMLKNVPQKRLEYTVPENVYCPDPSDENGFVGYLEPGVKEFWYKLGLIIELHHIWTAKWISLTPKIAKRNSGVFYPCYLSIAEASVRKGFWPMEVIAQFTELGNKAAEENAIVLITLTDGPDTSVQYSNILMEAISLYPIDDKKIYLDISQLYKNGFLLSEYPGDIPMDEAGTPLADPDEKTFAYGGRQFLDISRAWRSQGSSNWGQLIGIDGQAAGNKLYDPENIIHSIVGNRLVEPVTLEYQYHSDDDVGFLKYMTQHGVSYEKHLSNYEKWVSLVPENAKRNPESKLPVMLVFQEVYSFNSHLSVEAVSYWFELCRLVMQGELIVIFYTCECEEHNEFMYEIFKEAAAMYPIDRTRVYVTGYSHNSANATRFAYNHPDMVAAIAGGIPGMIFSFTPPEKKEDKLKEMCAIDMPCIMVNGLCEHNMPAGEPSYENSMFPVMLKRSSMEVCNCEVPTDEEVKNAFENGSKAERIMGIPGTKSEVLYLDGFEHYIVDVRNRDGKYHLRFVSIDKAPHNPFPTQQILEWSFVRRFARNQENGEIIELY